MLVMAMRSGDGSRLWARLVVGAWGGGGGVGPGVRNIALCTCIAAVSADVRMPAEEEEAAANVAIVSVTLSIGGRFAIECAAATCAAVSEPVSPSRGMRPAPV